ncbi:MAG: hypothetical protein LC102_09135 [Ignavibacteriales bacterium]|nr:MAG: hypothetical protein F9K26_05430 [Ignavibacteriaceae bacterium]MBW7872858.1 hypothetical protein [Ignavibacteria bacterium]MCZ2143578.1 hypothetical protein [Ignavibacteriales bacterium]MBV6444453.1 hypothetical protein [Ignavibacteriaceae bacterium]MBZ0197258.1 hypothetical protein [Ignavibacteriaceae bacterium]
MKNERWYEEVPLNEFGEDFKEIAQIVGKEKAIELYDRFRKTSVLFSNAPLYSAKKWWIRMNRHKYTPSHIARVLEVSQRFVYATLKEKKGPTLFD